MSPAAPRLSVIVATYRRLAPLERLVADLAAQNVDPSAFEVVVVDDGSPQPVAPALAERSYPFALRLERQTNAGPAAARHRGAELARGEVLVFFDDDMRLPATTLAAHLAAHEGGRAVVLGQILPDPELARLPLFERFHARVLAAHYAELEATGRAPRGKEVCTGNLSLRRDDYFAVGGFDRALGRSEDAELGLRLERAGVPLRYAAAAVSVHASDHDDLDGWLRRAYLYGLFERRIARKHPDVADASPYRWFGDVGALATPVLVLALVAPAPAGRVVGPAMRAAAFLDRLGLDGAALRATTLSYALQYMRGTRAEEGSLSAVVRSFAAYRAARAKDAARSRVARAEPTPKEPS